MDLLREADFDKIFPKEGSPDFNKHVRQNWGNLNVEKIEGKYCQAAILYQISKPKRNKLNKFYIFILWLFLCLERPWEKNWKYSLSEKGGKDIWVKIDKILSNIPEDFSDTWYPDIQTIRKYMKEEDCKKKVVAVILGPNFIKFSKTLWWVLNKPVFKKLDRKRIKYLFKFMNILETQRIIRKWDLMRKFQADKGYFDFLLKKAEKEKFIKIKKFPHNSAWIIYNG